MQKLKKLLAVLVCAAMATAGAEVYAGEGGGFYITSDYENEAETADGFSYSYIKYVENGANIGIDEKSICITGYHGDAKEVVIPNTIDGCPVQAIDEGAFEGNEQLTKVTIPNSVVLITLYAFKSCTGLQNVDMSDSIKVIDDMAFENCTSLANINIPDNVLRIGLDVFRNTALYNDDANWTDGVLYIGNHLIAAREKISGDYTVRPGTVNINDEAFAFCTGLTGINIPDSVTKIGVGAFESCTNLANVTIPNSVTSIGAVAFDNTALYNNAANWTDNVLYIGNHLIAAREKISGTYEVRPGTITISGFAFCGCISLTGVTIPDSVISIGDVAFDSCDSLISVTIPASVTSIGDDAFGYCESLADVYYGGNEYQWKEIHMGEYNDALSSATIHFNGVSVLVNGAKIDFDVPPMILDGTTMLPVRYALEPLGAEFVWDDVARTVTITARGKTVVLTVGSDVATVDGAAKTMLKPAMIVDGRTLIPVRFVAEELGYDVGWDGETQTVTITSK